MTTYSYLSGPCDACNQRSEAEYKCARVAELLAVPMAPLSDFNNLFDEIVAMHAASSEVHELGDEWVN